MKQLRPAVTRGAAAALAVGVVAGLLVGCTSDGEQAAPPPKVTSSPAEAAGTRCDVSAPAMNADNVVGVSDVGRSDTGGSTVTDVDYADCEGAPPLTWSCDLPFPWQSAAKVGSAMATLGVGDARIAYVVTPDRSVTETILNVDPATTSSAEVMRELGEACPGPESEEAGSWVRLGTTTAAMAAGPVVVVVDFAEGAWTPVQQQGVLRATADALGPA